jgi:hypothetical protein
MIVRLTIMSLMDFATAHRYIRERDDVTIAA